MGYLPNFKHDIFVSYAHADNAEDALGVRWVSDFQLFFKRAVTQWVGGHEVDVFFDDLDLHPNHAVDDVLLRARESAIFVPVVSTSYVARKWTKDEFNAFDEAGRGEARIFAVELLPPGTYDPPRLAELKRKSFWFKDEKQGSAPRKLTPKYEPKLYSDYLDDIAFLVAKRLKELHPQPQAPVVSKIAGMTALVAKVTDDLKETRAQVCKYLDGYGVNVLPKRDYVGRGAEFADALSADLKKADVFVQLLTEAPSDVLQFDAGGAHPTFAQFQFDRAKLARIPVLQWRHPDVKPESVTHADRALIEGTLEGSQVESSGLEQFKKTIKNTLERLALPAPPADPDEQPVSGAEQIGVSAAGPGDTPVARPPGEPIAGSAPPASGAKPYVFITADIKDQTRAGELRDKFVSQSCVAALLPTEETPSAKRRTFKQKINRADAVVFFYGEASDKFIGGWQDEYLKNGEPGQRRVEAVYHAPPEGRPAVPVNWPGLRPFGSRKVFTLDDVEKIREMLPP